MILSRRSLARAAGVILASAVVGCEQNGQSALHPSGPGAERIAQLWWLMLAAASAVFLLVLAVLYRALTHRGHRAEPQKVAGDGLPTRWVLAGGVALPTLVLVPLVIISFQVLAALRPPSGKEVLEVVVTGWQWWWDIQYLGESPQDRFRTANEIHIPVGRPVRIQLRSDDVIHSFWVPSLQGKLDLVPGQVNTTWIQADTAGVYRGECAEYCGLQHAKMQFRVIALPADKYSAWRAGQQKPAVAAPDSLRRAGETVFMTAGCALCHAIRGTSARSVAGPDLSHFASRSTIAAGTLPNTRGHLAGWIANPQAIKPGNLMPRIPLRPEELEAVVAYLSSLR
ncbi:MAG: cytochrome c oxidase subunit [Gemmatimonadales bacterium]|nr:cytochrome c oxidase subunit [Gemmatimonadales bacterium]